VAADFLGEDQDLASTRWSELERSAELLGVARLEWLGYGDSGDRPADPALPGPGDAGAESPAPFSAADPEEAAARLAAILVEERADVVTTYDPNGGYGHPDHQQVHRVGARAAARAGTPVVVEATINRDLMRMGVDVAASLGYDLPPDFAPESFDHWYTPAEELTHAVDVRAQLSLKRAAMEAHASQSTSADPDSVRSLAVFASLPPEYFELAFGTEWFVDRSRPPGLASTDLFDGCGDPGPYG
jgi:LmbE family N-acetylglucosaminyl deacetylase